MKIVSYPKGFKEKLLNRFSGLIDSGEVAEGRYYNAEDDYLPGRKSVPVTSCGAAIFSLLAYQKYEMGKTHVVLQSNTMRGLYTIARTLNFEVIICDCSRMPGFLAMDTECYIETISDLTNKGLLQQVVTVYSVIGGYLSPTFVEIEEMTKRHDIPFIVDMAHAHYLDSIIRSDYSHLAFSFYATKVLPVGEGGLISTNDVDMFSWIKRFLIYDRFDYGLEYGFNLRANELTACFIYQLMTDDYKFFFRNRRVDIAKVYRKICEADKIKYLDFQKGRDYNGYKFVIFDKYERVKKKNTLLTKLKPTSPVFTEHILDRKRILSHWCPPTYVDLYSSLVD